MALRLGGPARYWVGQTYILAHFWPLLLVKFSIIGWAMAHPAHPLTTSLLEIL